MRRAPLSAAPLAAALLPLALAGQGSSGQATDPVRYLALRDSARAALEAGANARAAEQFGRLVREAPGDDELWTGLALAEFRRGRLDPAREAGERAVALGHTFGNEGRFIIGRIHARMGRDDEALRWLRRALEAGYGDRPRLRTDPAFEDLRDDPAFRELAGIPPDGLSRDEAWRFDLAYLEEEVRRMHPGPGRPWAEESFIEAARRLHDRIPELDDEAIVIEMMRLVARLGDGHSAIYGVGDGSPLDVSAGALPLKFYDFSDGLYVVEADPAHRELVGARVERMGPLTPEEALRALGSLRGAENPMTLRWLGPQFYLRSLPALRAIGAAEGDSAVLALAGAGGRRTVTVRASDWSARRKLRPRAAPDTALWLRHVEENYRVETLEPGVVYLQFNQVRDAGDGPDLATFAGLVSDTLRAGGARDLVVDLRHNNGGNNGLIRPLVRALIGWEQAAPGHTIWVLSGRNTFSAAQNFLNRIERWTDAVIVGEPSSSSPNFVGEETNLELPWSRVHGSISNLYWQDSDPTDDRQWIYPDVPVSLSSEDYFGGRDPVLEAALELVHRGAGGARRPGE